MFKGKLLKKWMLRIGGVTVLAFALLLLDIFGVFAAISYALKNESQDNLSFSYESCDGDSGYGDDPVLRQEWVGDQLIVEGDVYPNCGTNWLFGSYEMAGDKLTLKYKSTVAYFFACTCKKRVTYKISDIPKREYSVSFKEEDPLVYYPLVNYFILDEVE